MPAQCSCGKASWEQTQHGPRCSVCKVFPTLGHEVVDWIEDNCVVPDGEHTGDPFLLTREQQLFLLWFYRLDPHTGRFIFDRGAQLVRPQKWGKGPLAAAIVCAEAAGPVLFAGWDANGQPVGREWPTPWIQCTAVSEGQTDNVWRVLLPMIELGSLKQAIWDTGQTRINLPGGGRIEPPTSSALSRLGQRVTFVAQDQAESWTARDGGHKLADTQRRNVAGMGGRWLETANAWDPRDNSVAQITSESGEPGVYFDDVDPGAGSVRNKADRRRMLKRVYGDAWWVDRDRIDTEIVALLARGESAQAERFFLNRKQAGDDAGFQPEVIDAGADPAHVPEPGSLIVVGVDGARFSDALAIVATEVETRYQWAAGIWQRPPDADDDYEHDTDEIDGVMLELHEQFDVWRTYVDPQYIDHLLEKWQGRWGNRKVLPWFTNRPTQIGWSVRSFTADVNTGAWSFDGSDLFAAHLKNARKKRLAVYDDEHRQLHSLSKDRHDSPRKIDAAMAAVLSWEARGDAVAAGATVRRGGVAGFA